MAGQNRNLCLSKDIHAVLSSCNSLFQSTNSPVCPTVNQVSQISTQINLDNHTSDASGHKEITTVEKAIKEMCTRLLINVGSLYFSYIGFWGWSVLGFFDCKLHNFLTFRQCESNSIVNSPMLMRVDIHTLLKLTSLLSPYTLFT